MIILMETHTKGDNAKKTAKRCGLDQFFIIDALGQSWGIWCLWDPNIWKIYVLTSSSQLIHMSVQVASDPPWFLTACYGSPHFTKRQDLWSQLREIHDGLTGSWAIIGDLNAITAASERKCPPLIHPVREEAGLISVINSCELIEARFVGDPFIWGRDGTYKSDHKPLLVKFDYQPLPNQDKRPFRFEAAWLTHNDFNRIVRESWGHQSLIFPNNCWMFNRLLKCGIETFLAISLRERNNLGEN